MPRNRNSSVDGRPFDAETIEKVWAKAKEHPIHKPLRQDCCGSVIARFDYGKEEKFGWEIDHIKPVSKQGTDDLSNLQPLQWETNRKKGDTYPWHCP